MGQATIFNCRAFPAWRAGRGPSLLAFVLAGAFLWVGCDEESPSADRLCVPGTTVPCQCGVGQTGAASCEPSGTTYGMCRCELVAGSGGNSGFGGTGGVAGSGGTGAIGGTGGTSGTGGTAGMAGTGGVSGTGGSGGTSGTGGSGGSSGAGGTGGSGGTSGTGGSGGSSGTGGTGGASGTGGEDYGAGETGRMVGFTAAHNAVRARNHTPNPNPPLPPLRWSTSLASTAQAYANALAADNCAFRHSMASGLGENLAKNRGSMRNPTAVTESWAGEEACWTFGTFMQSDSCDMTCTTQMFSNGCGHYTQIIWRNTTHLGCGMAVCSDTSEIWVCNYSPPGNYIRQNAY